MTIRSIMPLIGPPKYGRNLCSKRPRCGHRFLRDPGSYGPGVDRVDVIETHISKIFLAGDRVYKLKRAVIFPYLDFSSDEQRHRACDAELAFESPDRSGALPRGARN